ncbi:MAG: transketolase [Planctomycetaceae bacterium]
MGELVVESDSFAGSRQEKIRILQEIERKALWLSTWMIHHANHLRENVDGLKVGGHQASSASLATILTALYLDVLQPADRVAVKPHASPIFHAIQYLLGNQTRDRLQNFRGFQGAQAYPSRTKDADDVDFSTGSMGLGVAQTSFASMVQEYVRAKGWKRQANEGRMIALAGDAELDEGNVFEALYEGWKHGLRNVWWIVDYNRQSLDAVVTDRLFGQIESLFQMMDWRVVTLKYGSRLQAAFKQPGGPALERWLDGCPNSLYSKLVYTAAWRDQILSDLSADPQVESLLQNYDDESLNQLMTSLAGHDMEVLCDTFHGLRDDVPTCVIAYTIKGFNLPMAGHKDNHAGLMTVEQMEQFREENGVADGEEWSRSAGLNLSEAQLDAYLRTVPFNQSKMRRHQTPRLPVPDNISPRFDAITSTQKGFGRILNLLARQGGPLVDRIVTTSPDVSVSTNLGGWISRRGVFSGTHLSDHQPNNNAVSMLKWETSPEGQHIELGIAENNLFLMLAALGLSHELFGERLIPIGTLYDPFINRGLDALNYACYQDARFILVATPSGISLAAEGGLHQSLGTPLIGMAQDGLAAFEPAWVDEVAVILRWAFEYIQRDGSGEESSPWLRDARGGSVCLRLSTRPLAQPDRTLSSSEQQAVVDGGYWLRPPQHGAELAIVYTGAVAAEAIDAFERYTADHPGAGLLSVTSADRLNAGWQASHKSAKTNTENSWIQALLEPLADNAVLVTVIDGHPATLSWIGGVRGHRVESLGVEHFGQSGNLPDLYRHYGLDADSILEACERCHP